MYRHLQVKHPVDLLMTLECTSLKKALPASSHYYSVLRQLRLTGMPTHVPQSVHAIGSAEHKQLMDACVMLGVGKRLPNNFWSSLEFREFLRVVNLRLMAHQAKRAYQFKPETALQSCSADTSRLLPRPCRAKCDPWTYKSWCFVIPRIIL